MARPFLAASVALSLLLVFAYAARVNPTVSASPQELIVKSRTKGFEELKAEFVSNEVKIRLQNNHKETITAFAISFGDTTVKEDFVYSEIHSGIEPGETYEKSYPFSLSSLGAEVPTLHLVVVLLKDGTSDGTSTVAQQMKDGRLGQKIQLHRLLRVLQQEGISRKDIKALKGEITAALDAGESEARIIRKKFLPASEVDDNLSEALKNGLHWGREKTLRRLQALEQLPVEHREGGFKEMKDQAHKLFEKL